MRILSHPATLVFLLLLVVVLFGYKRLPDVAKSVGQSMKIFKSEIKTMNDDAPAPQNPAAPDVTATNTTAHNATAPVNAAPPAPAVPAPPVVPAVTVEKPAGPTAPSA
ncbi:twin-arginine translocase TatA/TatE family subunit [Cellulomonas sp. PhB150]|uniref:twin-arginine translocase TatA/TatE family subunit n=1 Tax=Cellulomonas sp. PhB150 TaxID=2485188 RepID=UPI000F9F4F2C|nr:twin-arginine translocase TatA/TatE family subunit [Cellulomonas sp. PhB150]ROS30646.1 sec-independent protein translocase protein TatA [Cellulomonas sp. PhB150]